MPTPLPPAEELLKVLSVKQLPQSLQIPKLYSVQFQNRMLIDNNLVILAARTDIISIYDKMLELEARLVALGG
jgi:hypothetical protein